MLPTMHALYPISGDPPTRAHMDILQRGNQLFPQITWGLGINPLKSPLLPTEIRLKMMQDCLEELNLPGVQIARYESATAQFAHSIGANVLLRGLRTASDLEAEMQLAHGNRLLSPQLETMLLFCRPEHSHISSSLARELALLDAPLDDLLPEKAAKRMQAHLAAKQSPA